MTDTANAKLYAILTGTYDNGLETRACTSCKGTGVNVSEAFTYENHSYPETTRDCFACKSRGQFVTPDRDAIIAAIRGRKPGTLRSAAPKDNDRAYYVWRLARFHGGVDVTMPIMAGVRTHGDPFVKELDKLADEVARDYFGSNMRAAYRWGRAMGQF